MSIPPGDLELNDLALATPSRRSGNETETRGPMIFGQRQLEQAVNTAVAEAGVAVRREVADLMPVLAEQEGAATIIVQTLNVTVNVGFADGGGVAGPPIAGMRRSSLGRTGTASESTDERLDEPSRGC